MSFASEDEVDCPCGETFTASLWSSVNLKADPDLRGMLMGGALNVATCPLCKGLVYVEKFMLIHDPENELMAFLHPKAREKERELLEAAMHRDVAQAQNVDGGMKISYPPELMFGLETLVDLLQKEEETEAQSAILEALAPELPVNIVKLPPFRARAAGLPRRVPLAGGGPVEERLKAGLRAVLAENDRLTVYATLLDKIEQGAVSDEALSTLAA